MSDFYHKFKNLFDDDNIVITLKLNTNKYFNHIQYILGKLLENAFQAI